MGFPDGAVVKTLFADVGDLGLIPGSGKSPGEGNGYPPQYSGLRNPMYRESDTTERLSPSLSGILPPFCLTISLLVL